MMKSKARCQRPDVRGRIPRGFPLLRSVLAISLLTAGLFFLTPALATPPATTTAPASVDTLLRQLSADDWAQREAAQKELVQIGDSALPSLRDLARTTTDEEVRQRAEIAIRKIEDQQLVGQTLVTLDMTDAPAEQVFAEIARQSFARLPLEVSDEWRAAAPRLTVKANREPFWQMLKPLCAKANVHPEWRAAGMVLAEGYKAELDGRAVVSGPFLVLLSHGECARTIGPARNVGVSQTTLTFNVLAEPKLNLLNRPGIATLKRAVDDQNRPLLPVQRFGSSSAVAGGSFSANLFFTAEAGAKSLRELAGSMPVTLSLRTETITLDKPLTAEPAKKRIGGQDVVLGPMVRENNRYLLTVECSQNQQALFVHNITYASMTKVLDAKGRSLPFQGLMRNDVIAQDRYKAVLAYGAAADGAEPAQAVVSIHNEIRDIQIEFEYKDLPLP